MKKYLYIAVFSIILVACEEYDTLEYSSTNGSESYYNTSISGDQISILGSEDHEKYNQFVENPFLKTENYGISSFSIDADGASYSNIRRYINQGEIPPIDAVRIEEMINYFSYNYPEPGNGEDISIDTELTECPWQEGHKLLRIGIKGKNIERSSLPPANIVLLVDVSGSMSMEGKLELLKQSFELFIENLRPQDKVAIVTYSGNAGIALNPTSGYEKEKIIEVLNSFEASGSTAGVKGITTAYNIATDNFIPNGNNRIIFATDGDFNVGPSSQKELVELIRKKRETGIYLTIVGMGKDNLNDALMEETTNNGNGTYEYIDSYDQARKVFDEDFGKFYAIAKDVRIKVAFNEAAIESYRLVGYENRLISKEKMKNENKDAGEIGVNQCVTALYELVVNNNQDDILASIDFKYKNPLTGQEKILNKEIPNEWISFDNASNNTIFAASVAAFSMKVKNSVFQGNVTYNDIITWSRISSDSYTDNLRNNFTELISKYQTIATN